MNISIKTFGILSILALAMTLNSCSKDEAPAAPSTENGDNNGSGDNNGNGDVTGEAFTIKAQMGDVVMSRATVKPGDGKSFTWETGDSFDLYQSSDFAKKNIFSIVNDKISSDGKSADFTCTDFALASDDNYYAFYPQDFKKVEDGSNSFSYTIPDDVYTQSENNNTKHLKGGVVMVAAGTSSTLASNLKFEHKTALLRLGVTNLKNDEVTVNSITLSSDLACFSDTYVYNTETSTGTYSGNKDIVLNFANGGVKLDKKDAEGSVLRGYAIAIPTGEKATADKKTLTITVTYNGNQTIINEIEMTEGSCFEAGKYYDFNVDVDYNRHYLVGEYSDWGWKKCQYLYDREGNGVYEGIIYIPREKTDGEFGSKYYWKITAANNYKVEWPAGQDKNYGADFRSCYVKLQDNNISTWDGVNFWGVVGEFNNWDNDIEMKYVFNVEHYLVAEVVIPENKYEWKIRGDKLWTTPNIGSNRQDIDFVGVVEKTSDNLKFTEGAGTYEIKWYFNLYRQKIVVKKK